MSSRAKCANCKSYFDKDKTVWKDNLQRICSSKCLSEFMDRKRPTKTQIKARKAVKRSVTRGASGIPVVLRLAVRTRDNNACRYCGRRGEQVHHINYRSEGGADDETNLILLCHGCHTRVHSSKVAYKPLLLAYIWVRYVEGRCLSITEVAAYVERLGMLTDLQRERLAG